MTFYQQLNKQLKTKHVVIVQRKDGKYMAFSCVKDAFGYYKEGSWWDTIEECLKTIGGYVGMNETQTNKLAERQSWKLIDAFDLEREEKFGFGERVFIKENAKEICEIPWNKARGRMLGKIGIITKENYSHYEVEVGGESQWFPHNCLRYPFEWEKKEITGEKKIKEKKIKKLIEDAEEAIKEIRDYLA